MKNLIKYTTATLVTAIITSSVIGQEQKDNNSKNLNDKSQDIVIRKKKGNTGKMTIVVDGDNVTINGKPVDEYKNEDVTIFKRNSPLALAAPRARSFSVPRVPLDVEDFDVLRPARPNKAMLGVMTEKADEGVRVKDVTKESGAEKAGLKADDVITKVGATEVKDPQDLVEAISNYKPNDKVDITYKRNGKELKTSATLGENKARAYTYNFNNGKFNFDFPRGSMSPENFNFNFNHKPRIGLQIQDVEEGKGVTVKDVDENSPASKAGLKEGDVITELNGKDITGVDDLRSELKDLEEGATIKLTYKRDGKNQTAEVKVPKRLKSADL